MPLHPGVDERTHAALQKMGKLGSSVRWGYLSPSDTESEIDEEMHRAMQRIGRKGAAARWGIERRVVSRHKRDEGRKMKDIPKHRQPEQLARHKKKPATVEETTSESESEISSETPSEEEEYVKPKKRPHAVDISEETRKKLHRAGLLGASARWHHDYQRDEIEGKLHPKKRKHYF